MLNRIKQISNINLYTLGLGCYIACILYQTDVDYMGSKLCLVSLSIILFGTLFHSRNYDCKKSATHIGSVVLFVIVALVSTLINATSPHYINRYIAFFVTYLCICHYKILEFENEFLKDIFCIAMSLYAILVSYSYIYNPVTANYIHSDVLLFGTLMDPNYVSIPFVAAVILCLTRLFDRKDIIINLIMLIANFLAILCAASRGAVVALAVSVFINFIIIKKLNVFKIISISSIIFILYHVFFPLILNSFSEQIDRMFEFGIEDDNGRFELWSKAIDLFFNYPIIGIGLGGMVEAIGHATHNTYIQVLTETGILGFILFILLVCKLLKHAYLLDKDLFIMFIACLVQIFFVDALGDRLLWLMFFWIAVLSEEENYSPVNN